MAARRRLDAELVRRRLAESRAAAQELIARGAVAIAGAPAAKAATLVDEGASITVTSDAGPSWASRAGAKLDGALDDLGVDVAGRAALDAGAAHGGFTDVLLTRGAASVVAIDVAYGQLDWRLRTDQRVTVIERTNVRYLRPDQVPGPPPQVVVADLSFISLRLVLPALVDVAAPDADYLLMVKPQFEAGRSAVGKGGVVRDPAAWETAIRGVAQAGSDLGLNAAGVAVSSLPGPAGNVEFFLHLCAGTAHALKTMLDRALDDGRRLSARG